jgi:hypothetical protein
MEKFWNGPRSEVFKVGRITMAFAVASTALAATAQDCKAVADPKARLACFDRSTSGAAEKPQVATEEAQIKDAVRRGLKDPVSAQFGTQTVVSSDGACQTVNARNSYGGYTGAQQAIVKKLDGRWFPIGIHDITHTRCIEVVKQLGEEKP